MVEGMVSRHYWRGRWVWLLKGFKWQNKDKVCDLSFRGYREPLTFLRRVF